MKKIFDLEREVQADESDLRVWRKIRAKSARRARVRKRRIWLSVACSTLALLVGLTCVLSLPLPDAGGGRTYAQDELRAEEMTQTQYEEICLSKGFCLPDGEMYCIDFEQAQGFWFEDSLFSVQANYLYNFDVPFLLYVTDRADLEITFFLKAYPVEEQTVCGVPFQVQIHENRCLYGTEFQNVRYFLTVWGKKTDAVGIVKSIFGART